MKTLTKYHRRLMMEITQQRLKCSYLINNMKPKILENRVVDTETKHQGERANEG